MTTIVVNQSDVHELLPMPVCIEAMANALQTLSQGDARLPLRTVIRLSGPGSAFATMPALLGTPESVGVKVISVIPGNDGTKLPSHQGATLLFDPTDGRLLAIIDASAITGIRTAAVSAVATRALAKPDAGDLAVLGAGVQARTHLEAVAAVRTLRRVRVWTRHHENAVRLSRECARLVPCPIETTATARAAVDGADIICTVTASATPVLEGAWLTPGAHINAAGASMAHARELDSAAVAKARLFVDRRESALAESGDYLIPLAEGVIRDGHIVGELGDVLLERVAGRRSPDEITLFKSLGLAVEDLAAGRIVYERALAEGRGTPIDLHG